MNVQNPTRARLFRRSLMAMACAAAAAPSYSQSAAAPSDAASAPQVAIQRVEVTGSRIKQIDAEGASPVQVIKRDDIAHTGATNVRELLDSLASTSTSGSLSDVGGSNSFASGASSASLRNLGKQSTLVLLNGRRIAAYPLADYSEVFSNIDTLPLDVIDRVEILKVGGSAVYGSDAVAGVINIITRSSYHGLQADASIQHATRAGFGSQSAALTGGIGDYAKDGFNLLGNVEFYHRDSLQWSSVYKQANPAYPAHSALFGSKSSYSYPGTIIGVGPIYGCAPVVGGICRYDRLAHLEAIPKTDRVNALLSGSKRLAGDTELFGEVLFSDIKVTYGQAFPTYGAAALPVQWGDPQTGLPKTFYYRGLPAEHPLNPTGDEVEFRYRFVDAPSFHKTDTKQYRALTGLKGTTSAWDWESAIGIMGGKTQDLQAGSFSDSGFKSVIGDYLTPDQQLGADFFNKPGGYQIGKPNSAAVLNTLFPVVGFTGKVTQEFWDGKISGDLLQLPAGPLSLATGFELRHESLAITPTNNLATGDIVGVGTSASDASRKYGAIFAEVQVPIIKHLDASLAGRFDKFPGISAHFSPKVGLRFQPADALLLRGTFETGFRAPNLTESAPSTKFSFEPGVSDTNRCNSALALSDALTAQADALPDSDPNKTLLQTRANSVVDNECNTSVANVTKNNPALKPETSKTFSLGGVLQATTNWSTSLDYWSIHRRNEINTRSTQDLLTVESTLPPNTIARGSLASDPTFSSAEQSTYHVTQGHINAVNNTFQNLSQTKTSGFDIGLNGKVATAVGELSLSIDGAYTLDYHQFSQARNGFGDNLAGRYGYSKLVLNTSTSLKLGDFSHTIRYVYNSPTKLQLDFDDTSWNDTGCAKAGVSGPECRISAYNRFDYALAYTGIKGWTVSAYIRNVLGKRPPVDLRAFGAPTGILPPSLEDVQGRLLKLAVSYKFL